MIGLRLAGKSWGRSRVAGVPTEEFHGDRYFTVPPPHEDGPDPVPVELFTAYSMIGARRGEIIPCDRAEVVKPRSVEEVSLPGARFRRVRVRHTCWSNQRKVAEEIDAWQRT